MVCASRFALVVVVVAGCSSGDSPAFDAAEIDAPPLDAPTDGANLPLGDNPGFIVPSASTRANVKSGGTWSDVGAADWSCLGTPSADQPPTTPIALSGRAIDFQTGEGVGAAQIQAFAIAAPTSVLGTATSSDVTATRGQFTMALAPLPPSARRYAFSLVSPGTLKTYIVDRYLTPGAPQTIQLPGVSESTAEALPAFIGITRDRQKALVFGAMVDCQGRAVSNAVATMSHTPTTVSQPAGMTTFYFSAASSSLPVRHNIAPVMNRDGLFMVLDVPVLSTVYVQVWGFRTDAELAASTMTLLGETRAIAEANSVTSVMPLRTRRAP